MPLRVLLLLPDGVEQPSSSSNNNTKPPKSPSSPSFTLPLKFGIPSRPSSRLSNNAQDYRSKPLPSPPPIAVSSAHSGSTLKDKGNAAGINRASHLTIPSTSGSSAGSSTEYVPSPPLSPSPTTLRHDHRRDSHDHLHHEGGYGYKPEVTPVRGLTLNRNKGGRVKPMLAINTKLPRTGKGVRYRSGRRASGDYTGGSSGGEHTDTEGEGSTSRAKNNADNDDGAATARRAVDDRLQHLLATTGLSPVPSGLSSPSAPSFSHLSVLQRISQIGHGHGRSTSPVPPPPLSPLQSSTAPTRISAAHRRSRGLRHRRVSKPRHGGGSSGRGRSTPNYGTDPPPPPTRSIAPFRIFSAHEVVPLDVVSDPRRAPTVNVKAGWNGGGFMIHSARHTRPKGTKGKYVRLVTLPPLPSSKTTRVKGADDFEGENEEELLLQEGVVVQRKGMLPTVLVEDEWYDVEDAAKTTEKKKEKMVPTVFMTELVAAQFDRPIPCLMYPPPPPQVFSTTSAPQSSPSSPASHRASTISQAPINPFQPTSKTYQLPLPILTPLQKSSLHTAGLLVYAVPQGYTGIIPPAECVRVGGGEEVVPPWVLAEGRLPMLRGGSGSGKDGRTPGDGSGAMERGIGSPRSGIFSLASPVLARSPLGLNAPSTSTSPSVPNGGSSGALSPRWPVEGLWSRARGYQRNSNASAESSMDGRPLSGASEAPSLSLPPATAEENGGGSPQLGGNSPTDSNGGGAGWSSSFSSIRARAQGYYAKDASVTSASPGPSPVSPETRLSSSKSEIISTSSADLAPMVMSSTMKAPINTSRSFGSLFLRTPSSTAATVTSSTGSAVRTSSPLRSSPSTIGVSRASVGTGEVLFEFIEPPRDGEIVKVEILETESVEVIPASATADVAPTGGKGWRGWGGRWGS